MAPLTDDTDDGRVDNATEYERGFSKRTVLAFCLVVLGMALGTIAQTAVSPMLVYLEEDFGTPLSMGQLMTTIYMLAMGCTMPITTYLSRRIGMRSMILAAWAFQIVGLACTAVSVSFEMAVAGRILHGVAGGLLMPLLQQIAVLSFPVDRVATAMGFSGLALSLGPNIGPTVGGLFCQSVFTWRGFFVFAAIVTIALAVATPFVIKGVFAHDKSARLDVLSLLFSCLGFSGLLFGFNNAANMLPTEPAVWAPAIVGIAFSVAFALRQLHLAQPLIDLKVFTYAPYRHGTICGMLLFSSFIGTTLILTMYIQVLRGGTALEAGLVFLPIGIVSAFLNPLSGLGMDRFGLHPMAIAASACLCVGAVAMCACDATTPMIIVIVLQTLRSAGVSLSVSPQNTWALESLPRDLVIHGSSLISVLKQVVPALSTAIMVLIITLMGTAMPENLSFGYQLAFGFSAVLAILCAVLYIRWSKEWQRPVKD